MTFRSADRCSPNWANWLVSFVLYHKSFNSGRTRIGLQLVRKQKINADWKRSLVPITVITPSEGEAAISNLRDEWPPISWTCKARGKCHINDCWFVVLYNRYFYEYMSVVVIGDKYSTIFGKTVGRPRSFPRRCPCSWPCNKDWVNTGVKTVAVH